MLDGDDSIPALLAPDENSSSDSDSDSSSLPELIDRDNDSDDSSIPELAILRAMVGSDHLQWAVSLGRLDITTAVMTMSGSSGACSPDRRFLSQVQACLTTLPHWMP